MNKIEECRKEMALPHSERVGLGQLGNVGPQQGVAIHSSDLQETVIPLLKFAYESSWYIWTV